MSEVPKWGYGVQLLMIDRVNKIDWKLREDEILPFSVTRMGTATYCVQACIDTERSRLQPTGHSVEDQG